MHNQLQKKDAFLILFTIFAISINLRPAITSIGPLLDIIRIELTLSNAQVSLLTSLPVICMGLFASLAPILNEKIGLKWTVYLMLFLISFSTAVRGFMSGFRILIITALLIGVAIAILGPIISTIIKQNFPSKTAFVVGIYSFGMGVGAMLSTGLTSYIFELTSSYLFTLSIWSLLGLIGLISWLFATKYPLKVRHKKANKAKTISPWQIPKAWLLLLFFGFQTSLFFSIMTWLVPIATTANMSLLKAGSLLSLMSAVQILTNLSIPILLNKFLSRKVWILLLIFGGLFATALLWSGSHAFMWAGVVFMGISLGGLFPISLLLPLDETDNAEETNKWTAMMQTGGFIISGTMPFIIAVLYDITLNHHYTYGLIVILFTFMYILTLKIHSDEVDSLN